jgi:hypothetical protein
MQISNAGHKGTKTESITKKNLKPNLNIFNSPLYNFVP